MDSEKVEKEIIAAVENLVLNNDDSSVSRIEYLKQAFKFYVAEYFIEVKRQSSNKDQLPTDAVIDGKNNLISVFRKCELAEFQRSEEWYDSVFSETVYEILNFAAYNHEGKDTMEVGKQNLEVNGDAYVNEGGLYVPEHLKS